MAAPHPTARGGIFGAVFTGHGPDRKWPPIGAAGATECGDVAWDPSLSDHSLGGSAPRVVELGASVAYVT